MSDDFTLDVTRRGCFKVHITRVQFSLAPSKAGTYNNQQGKTIREADGSALGHTVDFSRPDNMSDDEYVQHAYMILGRARSLEWTLMRNLPLLEDGDVDFSIFEQGPPRYIAEFLKRLEAWCLLA